MPDMGEAYGDENVPTDPYAEGLQKSYGKEDVAPAADSSRGGENDDFPESPFGQFTPEETAFVRASEFISDLAPGMKGLGTQVILLQRLLLTWYNAGRDGAE